MKDGQMTMRLTPEHGGSYTNLRLSGSVPTAVPQRTATHLVRGLTFWSGWPVECVLSVDREAASWCEWWTDLLAGIPEHHLKLRYRIRRSDRERRNR
jgi:hypothetical protein